MNTWTTIHYETREGFDLTVSITPEVTNPYDHFDESLADDVIEGINNGSYEWFTVRVQALRHNVPLGDSYLGCCLYADAREFVSDEYWHDMASEAISEAKETLKKLCNCEAG